MKRKYEFPRNRDGPRKRLINNLRIPIQRPYPPTRRYSRSVYIVARPLTKAGYFKILSEGKLPLCHWGLLVSNFNQIQLRQHIISRSDSTHCTDEASWGTLYEITNGEGVMILNREENFGRDLEPDWQYAILAHVGKTRLPDSAIYDHGMSPQG